MNDNSNNYFYRIVSIFNHDAILVPERIDKSSVPSDLYKYEVRHSDNNSCIPVAIGEYVGINFMGTLLSPYMIDTGHYGHLTRIDMKRDWDWSGSVNKKNIYDHLLEFMEMEAIN